MAFQDYQSIKNLGELQGALSFNDWYRKERTKQSMAEQAAIKASQGEGLGMALGLASRGAAAFFSGGASEAAGMGNAIQGVGTGAGDAMSGRTAKMGIDAVDSYVPQHNNIDIAQAMKTTPSYSSQTGLNRAYDPYSRLGGQQ